MNSLPILAALAYGAGTGIYDGIGGLLPSSNYRHAQRRAMRQVVDVDAEFTVYHGNTFRHRITGERRIAVKSTLDGQAYFILSDGRHVYRPIRKALQWLRNAEVVS